MTYSRCGAGRSSLVVLLALLAAPLIGAAQESEAWTPPPPAEMPDTFDWVQLPSGEWLPREKPLPPPGPPPPCDMPAPPRPPSRWASAGDTSDIAHANIRPVTRVGIRIRFLP